MSIFRHAPQIPMNFGELIVDNFAGGGGASTGIEMAVGRSVDIAINHDQSAVDMHTVNHPHTDHYCESVWDIDPREVTKGRDVGLAWFSPDCRHFSKAKGGKPVSKRVRGLAWIVLRWIGAVRPRVIMMENVEEFLTWGPLVENERGEMYPCPKNKGKTFKVFVKAIRKHGYQVDWKTLRACDYGAPTIRKRLFLVARRDGLPIVWPAPTHGPGLLPYRTAAEIIDWSLPCPSIFDRKRPLTENTLKRIAEGLRRYVLEDPNPFIIPITHHGKRRTHNIKEPLRTITTASRGEMALITPFITGVGGRAGQSRPRSANEPLATTTAKADSVLVAPVLVPRYGERKGQSPRCRSANDPLATVVTTGNQSELVSAFMVKHFGGVVGTRIDAPAPTQTTRGTQNQIVTSHLVHMRRNCHGRSVRDPIPTLTTGSHVGEVRAFLMKYYSEGGQWQDMREPMHTISTKARLGLVTIRGEDYQIVDIGMRMLQPHELYAAQGFPPNYIIDRDSSGKPITKTQQIAKCGNSVCPPVAAALVRANYQTEATEQTEVFKRRSS